MFRDAYTEFIHSSRQICRKGNLKKRTLFKDFSKEVYEYKNLIFRSWANNDYLRWQIEIDSKVVAKHISSTRGMINEFSNIEAVSAAL